MKEIIIFISAAFFEIFGCFAFGSYIWINKSGYWLIPVVLSLIIFAYLLTKVQTEFAGRAYAIYGGIYIVSSLIWLYIVEIQTPDNWDLIGAGLCIIGPLIILFMPR